MKLNEALADALTPATFDLRKETIVNWYRSEYVTGVVLEQKHGNRFHPVAHASLTLNNAEQSYAAHERKLLAVVEKIQTWRAYLCSRTIVVYTDHYHSKYLEKQKDLISRTVAVAGSYCCVILYNSSILW